MVLPRRRPQRRYPGAHPVHPRRGEAAADLGPDLGGHVHPGVRGDGVRHVGGPEFGQPGPAGRNARHDLGLPRHDDGDRRLCPARLAAWRGLRIPVAGPPGPGAPARRARDRGRSLGAGATSTSTRTGGARPAARPRAAGGPPGPGAGLRRRRAGRTQHRARQQHRRDLRPDHGGRGEDRCRPGRRGVRQRRRSPRARRPAHRVVAHDPRPRDRHRLTSRPAAKATCSAKTSGSTVAGRMRMCRAPASA